MMPLTLPPLLITTLKLPENSASPLLRVLLLVCLSPSTINASRCYVGRLTGEGFYERKGALVAEIKCLTHLSTSAALHSVIREVELHKAGLHGEEFLRFGSQGLERRPEFGIQDFILY